MRWKFLIKKGVEPPPGEGESLRCPLPGELDRVKSDDVGGGMLL